MISKNHRKVCTTLNYIEHFFILTFTNTGFVSTSAFVSLVGISIGITSSSIGFKIYPITAAIQKHKSIIKKKKKKHDNIVLLAKPKLSRIEVLISKALIDSVTSHDKSILINKVLKEYNEMKKEIKNWKT